MNYPGNCADFFQDQIETGEPMGPNYLGEPMWPTAATYDAETNTTHVDFAYRAPQR